MLCGCGPTWTPEDRFNAFEYVRSESLVEKEGAGEYDDIDDSEFVLYNMRLGTCALYAGNLSKADTYLGRATDVIDSSVGAGRGVVSVALWESAKYFKGETYERSALYYYRGIANFLGGKYDRARASFNKALLTDKQAVSEEAREDLAIAYYMLARSYLSEGETQNAQMAIAKGSKVAPGNAFFDFSKLTEDNMFLLVETGQGPYLAKGKHEDKYLMKRPLAAQAADVYVDGRRIGRTAVASSWSHQAATEGATGKDTLQSVKSTTWAIADCLSDICPAFACVSLLCAVSTHADTRAWRFIPDAVWVFSAKVPPGVHTVTLRYPYYEKQLEIYGDNPNHTRAMDLYGESPRLVEVAVQEGELVGYAETHYHISIPKSGSQTLLLRGGLGKHAEKQ